MFWDCGSYKTSRVRLLGKVKRNWMPVLVSPSCKALTKDTGRWVSSEAGHSRKETRPVLPQMVPIYLTCGSRTDYRCLGPHLDFPPGFPGEICDQTWTHQERGARCPGEAPSCLEPASCKGWPVFAAVGGSSSEVEELGSQSLSRVRWEGGLGWGS